jgi:hypothetical protein
VFPLHGLDRAEGAESPEASPIHFHQFGTFRSESVRFRCRGCLWSVKIRAAWSSVPRSTARSSDIGDFAP